MMWHARSASPPHRRRRPAVWIVAWVLAGALPALVGCAEDPGPRLAGLPDPVTSSSASAPDPCAGTHWVGAWGAAPSDTGPVLARQTARVVVTPHLGGRSVRVRLSNRYGTGPLRIEAAGIGLRGRGAALRPGTATSLRFDGEPSVTVPPGGAVVSDEASITTRPFEDVTVSVYVTGEPVPATRHVIASEVGTYVAAGDRVADESGEGFGRPSESWLLVEGIDVRAPRSAAAVVAFGDSITDGYLSTSRRRTGERNTRYPDFLARRLAAEGRPVSVVNAGVSSNRLLADPSAQRSWAGGRALDRVEDDVLSVPGVTDVIVLVGINDLRYLSATPAEVRRGLEVLVDRLQSTGLRVLLGTYPPTNDGAGVDAARREVNRWIREDSEADGVIDFDAALRDRADHGRLDLRYDSVDGVHPSARGYEAMASAVELAGLGGPCAVP